MLLIECMSFCAGIHSPGSFCSSWYLRVDQQNRREKFRSVFKKDWHHDNIR